MSGLNKRRVLVTRSREQGSELAALLEEHGLEAILVPTIAIEPPESFAMLDEAIAKMESFEWVLFSSANAVRSFAARWRRVPGSFEGPRPRVAAIGPATARELTALGWAPDVVPQMSVAESLAEALMPFAARSRMLLVRAEAARDVLPERLRGAGAEVTVAPAYRNVVPSASVPLLRSIFAGQSEWPDAITFSSSSTAVNLLMLMEAAGLVLPRDGDGARTILRASIGPITSRTLRELGYPPHVEAAEATVGSLVEALVARLPG